VGVGPASRVAALVGTGMGASVAKRSSVVAVGGLNALHADSGACVLAVGPTTGSCDLGCPPLCPPSLLSRSMRSLTCWE
jgi:hypothetical protein